MNSFLSRHRLIEILDQIKTLRVGVLGDFALDAYWYVDMTRAQLSRETPLFNRPVVKEMSTPGGSANVAWNLAALGITNLTALTILGYDWRANILLDLMKKSEIHVDRIISSSRWSTVAYAKTILISGELKQEEARLDFVNDHSLPEDLEAQLRNELEACIPNLDILVIADYEPNGVLSPILLDHLNSLVLCHPNVLFVVDSRDRICQFKNMVLKPNILEAKRAGYLDLAPEQLNNTDSIEINMILRNQTKKPVFITLGEKGCLAIEDMEASWIPSISVPLPVDPVGAGDTFMASIAACLGAGATTVEAGYIANLAASVTVMKLHTTGTATPDEIIQCYDGIE
ncbi:MAG: sugar kinase [Anaerolineaceae bacterium]|nr:sugar kinase [Anaerolineaceae bacterium]